MGSGAAFYVLEDIDRTKKRRQKRKAFDKNTSFYSDNGIKLTHPKVSNIKLLAIREKIQQQNRKERNKLILAFILAVPVLFCILFIVSHLLTS